MEESFDRQQSPDAKQADYLSSICRSLFAWYGVELEGVIVSATQHRQCFDIIVRAGDRQVSCEVPLDLIRGERDSAIQAHLRAFLAAKFPAMSPDKPVVPS